MQQDLYVVLGCYGRRTDNFISCSGVNNRILKVDVTLEYYEEIMNYFEGCRLFDKPMFDFNAVRNFLQTMQNRYDQVTKPLWAKKYIDLYQNFVITHRACGVFIRLELGFPNEEIEPEEEIIKVKGTKSKLVEPIIGKPKLRIVR